MGGEEGRLLRRSADGGWRRVRIPSGDRRPVSDIAGAAGRDVWVARAAASVLRSDDGVSWERVERRATALWAGLDGAVWSATPPAQGRRGALVRLR